MIIPMIDWNSLALSANQSVTPLGIQNHKSTLYTIHRNMGIFYSIGFIVFFLCILITDATNIIIITVQIFNKSAVAVHLENCKNP